MNPIKFKGQNSIYGKRKIPIAEYNGRTTMCFKLSFTEIVRILFTKKIYVSLQNEWRPLMPFDVSVIDEYFGMWTNKNN